jgi:hypothetical protein
MPVQVFLPPRDCWRRLLATQPLPLIDLQQDKRIDVKRNQDILRVVLVALGILSVISTIRATEPGKMDATKETVGEPFAPDPGVSLRLPFPLSENLSLGAVTESSGEEESASELNRKLTNPVSSIWSISNQFNNFELNNGQWNNNWNFQPVMPVSLTKDLNLITRPVMPFYNIVPHETSPGEFARDAGWAI